MPVFRVRKEVSSEQAKLCQDRSLLTTGDLLRSTVYRRMLFSILASSFGRQIAAFAIPLVAADLLRATPMQMGILVGMETLPFAIFSLPTGVILDRTRKLPVYVTGELATAVVVGTVPLAAVVNWLCMPWLYAVAFVVGLVNTTSGSAAQILLTHIVPRSRLVEAHAKNALVSSTTDVSGPAVAGLLIKLAGAPFALLANTGLLLISAVILWGIGVKEIPSTAKGSFWPSMRDGLGFVGREKLLLPMATYVGIWQFCSQAAAATQILFATRLLGLTARGIGLTYVALGIGAIGANSLMHFLARKNGPGTIFLSGFLVCGTGWSMLAVAPTNMYGIAIFAIALLINGAGAMLVCVNFIAIRQAYTPQRLLGRMTSTMRWLVLLPATPGALLGGWLAGQFGLRLPFAFAGIGTLLLAHFVWRQRIIRSIRILPTPAIKD